MKNSSAAILSPISSVPDAMRSDGIGKIRPLPFVLFIVTAVWAAWLSPDNSLAAAFCDPWIAKMVSVQGHVEVRRAGQIQSQPARLNDTYCPGDRISVGERSRADVALVNEPIIRLDQNTTLTLGGVREEKSIIQLLRGVIFFFSRLPRNLEISTPFVNCGAEGTEGLVAVEADRTMMSIFEGRVLASNQFGTLSISGGQSAVAEQGKAPLLTVVVRPRDAVRWALYYVPTLYFQTAAFPAGPDWQGMVRNSIEALNRGEHQAAFDAIRTVPVGLNEPTFFAYRAALLLTVGRYDEASRDLEQALSVEPNYSEALALQAIISVVQNEKERALELSKRAVTADPRSAAALIALSYAQQANFDLDAALTSLQQAVEVSPDNTLAWARLAELWLMFGQLNDALGAAQKAVSLDPGLARTQTVLGFAYLTQVNTNEARRAFERAIERDQADPLPRLGLGLAKIRDGELIEGRKEIDIAVSLDPDNALGRSYLGKAYFEEKMDKQARDQYEMSKLLDPKDPTSYFYDAIRKQTTNRPVEALQDLQKAIELNDNRAVYRSRLLLDSDLAARSAAMGRIYGDLGFQQLALVEGWKSVSADPSNFSAHRLLADSYSILPRHEIARVSELLRSQLLQPINTTPIPPSLVESNLFLISAGGPAGLSFNEFHPLFNRNGVNLQTTGLTGENNTYAGESVLSGIYKHASFSFGGFRFQTDGWRKNGDQRANIGNGFLQFEVSPSTSIQGEYRYRGTTQGDLQLNFFPDDFNPNRKQKDETHTYRIGLRHSLSPDSTMLGSFMYQKQDPSLRDRPYDIVSIDVKDPSKAFGSELQHLFRSQYISINTGVGYFNVDRERKLRFALNFFGFPSFNFRNDLDARHTNAYVYSYINPSNRVTFTLGASGDFFKTDDTRSDSRSQFNPKFGVAWNIVPNTTVRAAAFRVLKRTLITNQTLEPTQVAGFNQFYDDIASTESWRYGIGIDQKFSERLFAGVEFSRRDLNVPIQTFGPNGTTRENAREGVGRAYLFWTPHPWLALSGEYQYERFWNDDAIAFFFKKVTTHRVPVGFRFFHPSGFSAALRATYFHQDGDFRRQSTGTFTSGRDNFWVADAAISYRLPMRYGFITLGVTNLFDRRFKYQQTDLSAVNSVSYFVGRLCVFQHN